MLFWHSRSPVIQTPILWYPNPMKCCIVYTDSLHEHDGTEFSIAFLSQTFTDTQQKLSTTEQEAYSVYYAVTKWNYYLQGAENIICNDHKLLARFLNGKNANDKVNRWGLELATYNITFEWICGAHNKAADCLSGQDCNNTDAICHQPWWTCIQHQKQNCSAHLHRGSYFTTTIICSYTRCHWHTKQYTKIIDHRQISDTPTNAENTSIL